MYHPAVWHQVGVWSISTLSSSFSPSFSSSSAKCAAPVPHLSRPEVVPINSPARALEAAQRKPFCSLLPLPRSLFTQRWHIVCCFCLFCFVYLRHKSTATPSSVPLTLLPFLLSKSTPSNAIQIWPLQRVAYIKTKHCISPVNFLERLLVYFPPSK